jgi:hypothetical protein
MDGKVFNDVFIKNYDLIISQTLPAGWNRTEIRIDPEWWPDAPESLHRNRPC